MRLPYLYTHLRPPYKVAITFPCSVDLSNEITYSILQSKGKKKQKKFYPYRNQLMMSEWLEEVPEDFTDKWLMFVCPIGKRCLVVAAKGTTSAYSRTGIQINNFPSLLPGGCHRTHHVGRDCCILDCIFYETTHTYYVLDVMSWGGHPVYDSDTEFRSFWKATKIKDNAESISKFSRINPMSFIDLPGYPCTQEALAEVFTREWPVQVDGLLFVHKEAHYWAKKTPLATWLKANMVTDILGIHVSQEFLSSAPVLSAVAMEGVEREGKIPKKSKSKKTSSQQQQASMDVTTEGDAGNTVAEQIEY